MAKLVLIVDSGWLMRRNLFRFEKAFRKDNPEVTRSRASQDFIRQMACSVHAILRRFPLIDNVVIVKEGGSWRRNIKTPEDLGDTVYKGQRKHSEEIDWTTVYKAYERFIEKCSQVGITVCSGEGVEGDDWAWYWSRKLNAAGTSAIVWTTDCDLKQLVQVRGQAFTAWYNDINGLVLDESLSTPDDPLEFFMRPIVSIPMLSELKRAVKSNVSYIIPDSIPIEKILCGDSGDNVKAVVRYQKNGRTYKFSRKDYEGLCEDLGIRRIGDMDYGKIAGWIMESKKFKPYNFQPSTITEMLEYNKTMVWLDGRVIPDSIQQIMSQSQYIQAPMQELRSSYRVLIPANEEELEIEDIFNSLF